MEHKVLIAIDEDADVFAGLDSLVVGPGLEVIGVGHIGGIVVEETPPFAGPVLVFDKIGVNESAHFFDGDIGAFYHEHFGLSPVLEVITSGNPDTAVFIAVFFTIGCGVGLHAEDPLVLEADYVAGAGKVEVLVQRGDTFRLGPVNKIAAFTEDNGPKTFSILAGDDTCIK